MTACEPLTKTYSESKQAINTTARQIYDAEKKVDKSQPAVTVNPGYYVDTKPRSLKKAPAWLGRHITLRAKQLPMSFLVDKLTVKNGVVVNYQAGVNKKQLISMDYTGTIKGALDKIAAKTNYAYATKANTIAWQQFVDKTFHVSFMPGSSNYLVGQSSDAGNSSGNSSSGNVTAVQGQLNDQQYSNLEGKLSVWRDLTNTLEQLKSKDGKVIVSEATTSVTVHDYPNNVLAIERYINDFNREMTKEVSIQVHVLEVEMKKEFNFGINWNLIQDALNTKFALSGQLADTANLAATIASGGVGGANSGLTTLKIGANSHALINAMNTQAHIGVVTQPRVVTMNNQVAEIRITRDTGYLQSVATTATTDAGVTSTLTPGLVTDGFTLFLLPKIQDDKIYLQISGTLSTLTDLAKVSNKLNDAVDESSNATSAAALQSIQVPTLTEKHFNQRTALQSGTTLLITGFKQTTNQVKKAPLGGSDVLGGHGAQKKNIQTIVMITPTIIENAQ